MMRRRSVPAMFVAALVIGCLGVFAHADQAELYSLMIQQSPVDAGLVTPEVGIHRIPMGDQVMLQAVARPGFRFLYWLGDVSDSSTDQAVVVIDAPKIVVAVYGRLEHELVIGGGGSAEADSRADRTGGLGDIDAPSVGGASSLTASAGFTGGGRGGSSARPGGKLRSIPSASGGTGGGDNGGGNGGGGNGGGGGTGTIPIPGGNGEIPVPGGGGDPVPEPATIALLGLGAVLFLRRRPQ